MSRPPLADVLVLDLSLNLPGPYAARLLQDLGATVVKVEPPRGDPAASMPVLYAALNDGKDRIALDLRTDEGRAALRGWIARADVLIEGFRPGVAEKLGFGAEEVRALNPRLVYCSLSAFGQDGPLRDVPGHDLNLQALSGACHVSRDGWGRPRGLPIPIADLSASMTAALRVVAALRARDRDGEGQRVDVALLDAVQDWTHVWGTGVDLAAAPGVPGWARAIGRRWMRGGVNAIPHYGCFLCRDGRWIALGIVDEGHFWRALCAEMHLGPLARLPLAARALLGPALRLPLSAAFLLRPRDEWLRRLGARDVPVTPVLDPASAAVHEQVCKRKEVSAGSRSRADADAGRVEVP